MPCLLDNYIRKQEEKCREYIEVLCVCVCVVLVNSTVFYGFTISKTLVLVGKFLVPMMETDDSN